MCTLLVTSNPDHISHGMATPSFIQRGTRDQSIWSIEFTEPGKWKTTIASEVSSWGAAQLDNPGLFITHLHSPTGPTYGRHPAKVEYTDPDPDDLSQKTLRAYLWHNGQIINIPNNRWDTQEILKGIVSEPHNWSAPIFPHNFINWHSLDDIEGSFAGVLYVEAETLTFSKGMSHPGIPYRQGALFLFRNAMSPLVYRDPFIGSPVNSLDAFFLHKNSYVASVPLSGHENSINTIPKNEVYQVYPAVTNAFALGGVYPPDIDVDFAGEPVAYFENHYNPYGI